MEKFENLNELIIALLLWITSNTDYINPKQLPEVKFLKQNELSQLAYNIYIYISFRYISFYHLINTSKKVVII